jgi:hypothetical protein
MLMGNSERILGMVCQFDEDDKGHLTENQLFEFISFFIDGAEEDEESARGAAKALHAACREAGTHVNADTIFTFSSAIIKGRETSARTEDHMEERTHSAVEAPPSMKTINEEGNDTQRTGSVFE